MATKKANKAPSGDTRTITLRIPEELAAKVDALAESETRSFNLQVQHLLKLGLEALKK